MSRARYSEDVKEFPKRIEISVTLILMILAVGTLGFKFSAGISFQDAFIMTLETLAFMFHSASGLGKVLEIFLAIFGVFLIWWVLWGLFDMLLEGNLGEYLKISKFLSKLRKMRNHYIIAGGGRVGEEIASNLAKTKKEYIIVEREELVLNRLKKKNMFVMHGDITDEEALNHAGVKTAKAIIIALPEAEKNLLVTMMARELNPEIEVYARADKPALASKLKKAGAKVVIVPEQVAAEKFLQELNNKP